MVQGKVMDMVSTLGRRVTKTPRRRELGQGRPWRPPWPRPWWARPDSAPTIRAMSVYILQEGSKKNGLSLHTYRVPQKKGGLGKHKFWRPKQAYCTLHNSLAH